MSAFIVAPEAEGDAFHIWLYLVREAGMETANRVEAEILTKWVSLTCGAARAG